MIDYKYYGLRHDCWGLGILAYFLFAGVFPFEGETDLDICEKITNCEPDWDILRQRKVPENIIEWIKKLLLKDPNLRATIRQAMNSKIWIILDKLKQEVKKFKLKENRKITKRIKKITKNKIH